MKIDLAQSIKYFRKEKNLTQNDLAKIMNTTRTTISSWETGASTPDIYTLIKLAEVLNITLITLIGENETDKYFAEIRDYNRKKLDERFGENRISLLHHKLDLLTENELNDIEFAFKIIEERRKGTNRN